MKVEETKTAIKSLTKIVQERKETFATVNDARTQSASAKEVFREGNESKLIKLGVALIVFPEPTPISEIVGGSMVAAGAVKKGIRNRAAFAEDIGKDFKKALRDLSLAKDLV
jgi:hypothetical protein